MEPSLSAKLVPFLQTVSATAALACGLLFLRFWRQTGHRIFAFFGTAFWLMAICWGLLALLDPGDETRPLIYTVRVVAYLLLLVGMVATKRGD